MTDIEEKKEAFELIYGTAVGRLAPLFQLTWVESLWAEDKSYRLAYRDFWKAREYLCERFGIDWEDDDLELFMNGILAVENDLAWAMFEATLEFVRRGYKL